MKNTHKSYVYTHQSWKSSHHTPFQDKPYRRAWYLSLKLYAPLTSASRLRQHLFHPHPWHLSPLSKRKREGSSEILEERDWVSGRIGNSGDRCARECDGWNRLLLSRNCMLRRGRRWMGKNRWWECGVGPSDMMYTIPTWKKCLVWS